MDYLNSAYLSGVNPLNQGKFNSQQQADLSGLIPQNTGFYLPKSPMVLDPAASFQSPGYSQSVSDYNTQLGNIANQEQAAMSGWPYNHFGGQSAGDFQNYMKSLDSAAHGLQGPFSWMTNGQYSTPGQIAVPNLNPSSQPYYDPYYPNESMLALKNWLTPQVESQAQAGLHARGLDYSGAGTYANESLQRGLSQLTPYNSAPEALMQDLSFNFGPGVANSIVSGGQIPGATAAPGSVPGEGQIVENTNQEGPLYSVVSPGGNYAAPGYFYNPTQMPDISKMTWLGAK